MQNIVELKLGLPAQYKEQAVDIFAAAFENKFKVLMGDGAVIRRMLAQNLNPENAIVALDSTRQELLGILGLHQNGKAFLSDISLKSFIKEHGYIMGTIRGITAGILFERKPANETVLLMDGIAVSSAARGRGIGTHLFQYLFRFAREKNYQSIRLDVIDENQDARRLYEKLGFQATRHENVSYLSWLIYTRGVTTMVYRVNKK